MGEESEHHRAEHQLPPDSDQLAHFHSYQHALPTNTVIFLRADISAGQSWTSLAVCDQFNLLIACKTLLESQYNKKWPIRSLGILTTARLSCYFAVKMMETAEERLPTAVFLLLTVAKPMLFPKKESDMLYWIMTRYAVLMNDTCYTILRSYTCYAILESDTLWNTRECLNCSQFEHQNTAPYLTCVTLKRSKQINKSSKKRKEEK